MTAAVSDSILNGPNQPGTLRLNGFTRAERLACTARIREMIVSECAGWISDFNQFSNSSINVEFEIPFDRLHILAGNIAEAEIILSSQSETALKSISLEERIGSICGTLQVSFIHNEPDLRRKIPAVPG